jgi:hypothetical protein
VYVSQKQLVSHRRLFRGFAGDGETAASAPRGGDRGMASYACHRPPEISHGPDRPKSDQGPDRSGGLTRWFAAII